MRLLLLASLLLSGCTHGVTLTVSQQTEMTALACDAVRVCQAHGNLSEENWPLMPVADGACVNLAQKWLAAAHGVCR